MSAYTVHLAGYRFGGVAPSISVESTNAREACAAALATIETSDLPLNAGRDGRALGAFDLDNCAPETGWWRYRGDGWKADVYAASARFVNHGAAS